MIRVFTRFFNACTTGYRVSAPASTFLLATVFTLVVAFTARFAVGATIDHSELSQPAEILYSPSAQPGGQVHVAVEMARTADVRVYLPGLAPRPIALDYDADTGYHLGHVPVPETAPEKGYCTLRIVFADGTETDVMVTMASTPTAI